MTLAEQAHSVLTTASPNRKASLTQLFYRNIQQKQEQNKANEIALGLEMGLQAPLHPARPEKPKLVSPREMPGHKALNVSLSVYLLHSLAHIELNAIDLAWDTVFRFLSPQMPIQFYTDFVSIAADEARHFELLCERLQQLGHEYGSLPAHDKLWHSAERTKFDLKARLANIQLGQEARGLDSCDRLVAKFLSQNDKESARLIDRICYEEIRHVKIGVEWFKYVCARDSVDFVPTLRKLLREYNGLMPPPINEKAREAAGLLPEWYKDLIFPK